MYLIVSYTARLDFFLWKKKMNNRKFRFKSSDRFKIAPMGGLMVAVAIASLHRRKTSAELQWDLFRLYILFSQYRSCDDTQEIWSFVLFIRSRNIQLFKICNFVKWWRRILNFDQIWWEKIS